MNPKFERTMNLSEELALHVLDGDPKHVRELMANIIDFIDAWEPSEYWEYYRKRYTEYGYKES